MNFLRHHGAVVDLRSKSITLTPEKPLPPDVTPGNLAFHVVEDHVTIPPLSSVIISVGTEQPADLEGVIEGDQHLLLSRQICVARGIAELHDGKSKAVLPNFNHEYSHLNIGTTVAYIYEFVDAKNAFGLFGAADTASADRGPQPNFDHNPRLPKHKEDQLKALLLHLKGCFSSS